MCAKHTSIPVHILLLISALAYSFIYVKYVCFIHHISHSLAYCGQNLASYTRTYVTNVRMDFSGPGHMYILYGWI